MVLSHEAILFVAGHLWVEFNRGQQNGRHCSVVESFIHVIDINHGTQVKYVVRVYVCAFKRVWMNALMDVRRVSYRAVLLLRDAKFN